MGRFYPKTMKLVYNPENTFDIFFGRKTVSFRRLK